MTEPSADANKGGRPSIYSPEIVDAVCALITEGKSLRQIAEIDGMPGVQTILTWVRKHEEFRARYELAMDLRDDADFDELRDIAANPLIGTKTTTEVKDFETITKTTMGDNVDRSKLMADVVKWRLARRSPKKYGDRVQQEHSGGLTITKVEVVGGLPDVA